MPRSGKINTRLLIILCCVAPAVFWYGYVLADQLIFHGVKQHDGWAEVDLKALGCFPFNPDTDTIAEVPTRFRALDGKRVVLQGFMNSARLASETVRDFEFVYNKQICCNNGPPLVQERVYARCKPGQTVTYYNDNVVTLTGILHVKIERDRETGTATAVYELDVEKVEP